MLLIKKVYFASIRAGTKTTTLRYWRRAMVRAGEVHTVRGLGRVRIESVRQVEAAALTDEDARADGFADLADLLRALADYYPPDGRAGRALFQVRFRYLGDGKAAGADPGERQARGQGRGFQKPRTKT